VDDPAPQRGGYRFEDGFADRHCDAVVPATALLGNASSAATSLLLWMEVRAELSCVCTRVNVMASVPSLKLLRSAVSAALLLISVGSSSAWSEVAASAPDGQAIFQQRCATCHGDRGEGRSAAINIAGPCIQAVHNPGDVMTAMEVGPSHMPRFSWILTVPEMRSVADYVTQQLATIPLTGGDVRKGGELYRIYCAACHRTAVRGGALVFTGTNAPSLVDKSPAIVAGAIRSGPGPMPSFPASILSDQQLASVVEYVKFAQHPPNPGGNPLHWYGPVPEGFIAWLVVFTMILITGWIERGGRG